METKDREQHRICICLGRLLAAWFSLLCLLSLSSPALARSQVSRQGIQLYTKGEFDKAIISLQKALKKKPGRSEKVRIYKYIGLSQYTLGRRMDAEKSFEQCLHLNPECSIEAKESLDESALPFFLSIKKDLAERKSASRASTRILVRTTAKDAEIILDGTVLGQANTSLEAEPGIREIIVQAKGYRPRLVRISINKLVENVYDIDLDKLPAKDASRQRLARDKRKSESRRDSRTSVMMPIETEGMRRAAEPIPSEAAYATQPPAAPPPASAPQPIAPAAAVPPPAVTAAPAPTPPGTPIGFERTPVSFAHFLPLGAGQFFNGDYLLGAVFLSVQVYAATVFIQTTQDIRQAQRNESVVILQAETDPTITQEQLDEFAESKRLYVKRKQQTQNIAIGAAAGSYLFGVTHSLLMRPYVLPAAVSLQLQPGEKDGLQLMVQWDL